MTIACEDRDFVEWHGGARHAAVWVALVERDDVGGVLASARAALEPLLHTRYERAPHITVAYAGPLPAHGAMPADPIYTASRFHQDLERLRGLRLSPFEARIGGWGSFQMAPYLEVQADEFHAVNAALTLGSPSGHRYRPHLTVGLYRTATPMAGIAATMSRWQRPHLAPLRIDSLALVYYETHDTAGPLRLIGNLSLHDAAWHPSRHTVPV